MTSDYFTPAGRLAVPPEKEYREVYGKDEIFIAVYKIPGGYLYSANCKLGALIKSSYPHADTLPAPSAAGARQNACSEVASWIKRNRDAKKHYAPFTILEYRQLELPFD